MHLTKLDRRSLINQFKILERLDPEEASYYKKAISILEGGFEANYDFVFQGIIDPINDGVIHEVLEILSMFRHLHCSYKELSDKSGISEESTGLSGFDANNEHDHLRYARYLVEEDSSFKELGSHVYNSHMPRLRHYRQMLERYQEIIREDCPELLSKEAILKISQ